MRYLLKINIMMGLGILFLSSYGMAQVADDEIPMIGERLASRTEAITEMSMIGRIYQSTDFLSYNISYDFADSANASKILEHKGGKYILYDNLFWGLIDSTVEYMQGQQNYVVVDHDSKIIYIYDKLDYSKAINVPLLDSLFNEVSIKDLILTRPGGIFKKLTIQYMPDLQYKQIDMVYDSTTYLLKSIAYNYNTTYYDPNSFCDGMSPTLNVPSTSIPMPVSITPTLLTSTYKNFLVEFPGHVNGATVRMYKEFGTALKHVDNLQDAYVRGDNNNKNELKELWIAPAPSYSKPFARIENACASTIDSISPPAPKMMLKAAYASGTWVDSTMNAIQLFEWYMNQHLDVQYTSEVYADWLVNICGYKMYQLPWSTSVAVQQDTLQNIWNRFAARYPASQLSITETMNVPVVKGVSTDNTSGYKDGYTDDYMRIVTWTNGYWYTIRATTAYDLEVLPQNATIQSAYLSLYANKPSYSFAAQFRYATSYPYLQIQAVKGLYIPNKSNFNIQPDYYYGTSTATFPYLSTDQVNSGNSSDFWSNQNYLNQNITALVSGMYSNLKNTGINYPVQYKLSDESYAYKAFSFGSVVCSDVSKRPVLNVTYNASRSEVFAAYVNKALGTYLTYAQIKDLFKYAGKLDINSDCTATTAGVGCEGALGRSITAITTIGFTPVVETEIGDNIFGESRYFYKIDDNYYPQNAYSGYTVVPVLRGN